MEEQGRGICKWNPKATPVGYFRAPRCTGLFSTCINSCLSPHYWNPRTSLALPRLNSALHLVRLQIQSSSLISSWFIYTSASFVLNLRSIDLCSWLLCYCSDARLCVNGFWRFISLLFVHELAWLLLNLGKLDCYLVISVLDNSGLCDLFVYCSFFYVFILLKEVPCLFSFRKHSTRFSNGSHIPRSRFISRTQETWWLSPYP